MNPLRLAALSLLFLAPDARSQPPAAGPIGFDAETMRRHRIAGEQVVVLPRGGRSTAGDLAVEVIVSPEGEVVAARVDAEQNYRRVDPAPAIAAARLWRFRPFLYRGVPVAVRGTIQLDYRGVGEWRDRNAPFPPIDYARLNIRLVRSACFGSCPDYTVTIDGQGNVVFSTEDASLPGAAEVHRAYARRGVLLPGVHRARIDRATLDGLIQRFRAAGFFGLKHEYVAGVTDNPSYALTFASGGRGFTVIDYVGEMAGMPSEVTALEQAVDEAAGTARWVLGDANTVAGLREEGFDFSGPRAMELALASIAWEGAHEQLTIDLLQAGVPLDPSLPPGHGAAGAPLGEQMLLAAIRFHRPRVVAALASRGWLARIPRDRLSRAFAEGGGGCDPTIAQRVVAAGADPMARTREGEQANLRGRTALLVAVAPYGPCMGVDRRILIDILVGLGVDINATNEAGETALFGVEDPDLQEQLLALGARADVRDRAGNSPAFSSWNDRIVLGLLEAGADWRGRYFDGKTLRQQAHERDMPSVIAWLDAHGAE